MNMQEYGPDYPASAQPALVKGNRYWRPVHYGTPLIDPPLFRAYNDAILYAKGVRDGLGPSVAARPALRLVIDNG